MKRSLKFSIVLALVLLAVGLSRSPVPSRHAKLEFVPLIQLAPHDADQNGTVPPACITPAPVSRFRLFHCYRPSDIFAAYGVDQLHAQGITGKGQTIVIVDSYGSPTAQQDLDVFSDAFGLPRTTITTIHPTGTPTFSNAMHGVKAGWAFETSLDLQWAHAIAPDANLVLVAANPAETEGVQGFPSMFLGIQQAVNLYPGAVISESFGVTEQSFNSAADVQVARFDEVYRQAVANRITVVSSSGDSGTANIDKQGRVYPFPTASWPSSSPLVTSAGGTWLQFGWRWNPTVPAATYYACLSAGTDFFTCATPYLNYTTGPGRTEAVWKEDWLPAATGGGRSVLYPTPSFQSGIPASLLLGTRGQPDVSWNAAVDGGVLVYISFPGTPAGWEIVGGTSAAAPQISALVALANQARHALGKSSIGHLNPVLYTLSASNFTDIVPQTFGAGGGVTTLDSNAQYGSGIAGMTTTTGYDLTTGFGSPKAVAFVSALGAAP